MSGVITLSPRTPLLEPIEAEGLAADRLAVLAEHEIASLPVWLGRRAARLGDFFRISGGRSSVVRVEGDVSKVRGLAAGMAGGEMIVEGNVGDDVACGMAGGVLRVTGNAGDRLAAAAPGASKGMTGGEVIIAGSAGAEAAARTRRGLVVIGGEAGPRAGRAMIAGSIVVLGRMGADAGSLNKRGSIVAAGGIVAVPKSYRYACTYRPPHIRLTMVYLRRRYGMAIDERLVAGTYRRYCGDAGDPGKGEILEWAAE